MNSSEKKISYCDTLIIGSSMAGGCLARQLKLKHPDMKIVVLEKKTEFDYWVGESTLESFWNYAVKDLNLGFYLDTNHIYKHGLRFFYDSPAHDLPIQKMSEVGRSWFHTTPAHQLDRKRFDEDLYKMNIDAGIDIRLGVGATELHIDKENGHTVEASDGIYKCKWLVDAAGFGSPIGKKYKIIKSNNDTHPIDSYWGRFTNIANLDLLGDMVWREKVKHTTRTLATTHFMYGAYWIWLIPISAEMFSIGVTIRTDMNATKINNETDFLEFLKTHQCMRQLITDDSELIDFKRLRGISRQAKKVFSEDRWFLTGMAAAVLDPLLSPGSALLADNNRMIGDLIASDMKQEKREFTNKVKAYNAYNKVWIENFFLHIKGHYHDCYDRQRVNFETLLMQWFGIILPISMSENWGYDPTMTDEQFDLLDNKAEMMLEHSSIHRVEHVVVELHELLKARGIEYQRNEGQFYDIEIGENFMRNTRTMGKTLCPNGIASIENQMLVVAVKNSLKRLVEADGIACNETNIDEVTNIVISKDLSLKIGFDLLTSQYEVMFKEPKIRSSVAM